MINREEIQELLESTGFPVAYNVFPKEEEHAPPFICWIITGSENFAADDAVYFMAPEVQVELYTPLKEEDAEQRVEEALSAYFYNKDEGWLEDEEMYMVTYQLTM